MRKITVTDAQRKAYWELQAQGYIGEGMGVRLTTAQKLVDLGLATMDRYRASGETHQADRKLTWTIKSVPEDAEPLAAHYAMRRLPIFESLMAGMMR